MQPLDIVVPLIGEIIFTEKHSENIRLLDHAIRFAEFQFGKDDLNTGYRDQKVGDHGDSYELEISFLHNMNTMVAKLYVQSTEFGEIAGGKMAWPYAERSLSILNNWLSHFDSIANDNLYRNKKSLREERKISTLRELVSVESQMACVMIDSRQFDAAEVGLNINTCMKISLYMNRYIHIKHTAICIYICICICNKCIYIYIYM
jgi:hypothetical protein